MDYYWSFQCKKEILKVSRFHCLWFCSYSRPKFKFLCMKKVLELKWVVDFYSLFIVFLFACKHSLLLNNLKTKKARNAKISGFAIHVDTIIFLLLHNLHHWMCIITKIFFKLVQDLHPSLIKTSSSQRVLAKIVHYFLKICYEILTAAKLIAFIKEG